MQEQKVIWIVSYPKSGNTWMRALIREYLLETVGTAPVESNDAVPYFYHTVSPMPVANLVTEQIVQLRPAAIMHLVALHHSRMCPSPALLIKSHSVSARVGGLPLFSPLWSPKVIYLFRDPRDILVSYADHTGSTLGEIVELMNSEVAYTGATPGIPSMISTWSNHVNSWVQPKNGVDVLTTSYEFMHEDTTEVLRKVVGFCGWEVDEIAIKRAVRASSFSMMQYKESKDGFPEKSSHQNRFFRRGIVGSYALDADDVSIAAIERDHGDVMKQLGYLDDN